MKYDLIKITKKEYANDILKGNLYMNPLSFFRKCENDYMDDMTEGICGDIPKNQVRQHGYDFSNDFLENIVTDNILMISDRFSSCNLFCMYSLFRDDVNKNIAEFNEDLLQFADTAVWIKDVEVFKERVKESIYAQCQSGKVEYGSYGRVRYYDVDEKTNRLDSKSCFDKRKNYQWQREWRICLWTHNLKNEALSLSIGDISDIACIVPARDLDKVLKEHYRDYTYSFQNNKKEKEVYTTVSNGEVLGRLMFRYTDMHICNFVRSDNAEALNHLSQYYELQGKLDKAETTLKEIIEVERNWENYRLLINFYKRKKKFDDVEKIYLDLIRNHLDMISDKKEFFYEIHQYYMQMHKPYDAGLIYTIWSNEIFPEETSLALKHDIYVGLNMSDKAIEVADELVDKFGQRQILNYYYALNYMYLLNTNKARKYMKEFQKTYSSNMKQNEYTNIIEDKLDILEGKKEPVKDEKLVDDLSKINPTQESLLKMKQETKPICIIEDVTLYALFKAQCEWYLDVCKKILITAKAVHQIVDEYCLTGDKYLFKIIQFIKENEKVTICSPALVDLIKESFGSEDDMIMLMTKVLALEVNETLKKEFSE